MQIIKLTSEESGITYTGWGKDCGGFKNAPKGKHLDTQLFPNCKRKGKKKKKTASIIIARHGDNILDLWRAWVNKKIDNVSFVNAVYSVIDEVSPEQEYIKKGIMRIWNEYQKDKNTNKAANNMASLLGQDPIGFKQRVAAVELKPRFCKKCKNPVGKMSDSAWNALNKSCDDCSGSGEKEIDKSDPSYYKEDEDAVEAKTFNLKQYKKAQQEEVGDVWKFETPEEDLYAEYLNDLCTKAIEGDTILQNYLANIFEEDWESVKKKLLTEGSVWYVWWMDGLRKFMSMQDVKEGKNQNQIKTAQEDYFETHNVDDLEEFGKQESFEHSMAERESMEDTVPCKVCGKETKMMGTQLCDRCWMVVNYLENPVNASDKAHVYRITLQSEPKIVERAKQMIASGEIK